LTLKVALNYKQNINRWIHPWKRVIR